MAEVVQAQKKIALLHRYPKDRIKETNAAFPYLEAKGIDVLTFKTFDRTGKWGKFFKSLAWIFYAPLLVWGKGYDVIYCDDSYPFYPALVKLVSPRSKVVIRIGDFHLMYLFCKSNELGWWEVDYNTLHWLEKKCWDMVDEIIPISDHMEDYIRRGRTILDPVDPKDFPMSGCKNHGTVMFHGLLTKNKNVDIMLEAARCLPMVSFVVIGDGPDKRRLQSIAPHNVYFKGWVPFKSICRYIETCAVGVALRSDNPGNEYVVTSPFLQYGIMGKPCLVTRRKVFGDYEWQFSTVEEMVWKIQILLVAKEEGEKLREYVLKNHHAERIAGEIWGILNG